jgi:hypothetical protein
MKGLGSYLLRQDAHVVVDVPGLDKQPLSELPDLRVEAWHQAVKGLDESDLHQQEDGQKVENVYGESSGSFSCRRSNQHLAPGPRQWRQILDCR